MQPGRWRLLPFTWFVDMRFLSSNLISWGTNVFQPLSWLMIIDSYATWCEHESADWWSITARPRDVFMSQLTDGHMRSDVCMSQLTKWSITARQRDVCMSQLTYDHMRRDARWSQLTDGHMRRDVCQSQLTDALRLRVDIISKKMSTLCVIWINSDICVSWNDITLLKRY